MCADETRPADAGELLARRFRPFVYTANLATAGSDRFISRGRVHYWTGGALKLTLTIPRSIEITAVRLGELTLPNSRTRNERSSGRYEVTKIAPLETSHVPTGYREIVEL